MEVFTLSVTLAVSTFVMAITAFLLYLFSNKKLDSYLLDWSLASICFLVYGILAVALATGHLNNEWFPLLPNTLFLTGHAAVLSGVYELTGRHSARKFIIGTAVFSICFHLIPAVSESFFVRVSFLYPFIISIYSASMYALWRDRKSEYSRAYIPLALVFGMYILQTLLRSFIAIAGDVAMEFLGDDIIQTSGTLATIVLFFALTICFSLTISWRKEVDLRKKAITDHLTGWLNRSTLEITATSILEECKRNKTQASFLLIDIDKFKSINDRFGHSVGDMAIKHVCRIAAEKLRGYDKCFRLGGEEFLVILKDTSQESALQLSSRIRQSIENNPLFVQDKAINLTVSIGVSSTQPDSLWNTVLDKADQALYNAKKSGRNIVSEYKNERLVIS